MSKYADPAACGQPTENDPYTKRPCCQRRISVDDIRFPASPQKGLPYHPSADFSYPQSGRTTGTKFYTPFDNSSYLDPATGDVMSREQWERRGRFDVMSTQGGRVRSSDDSDSPRRRVIRV